MSDFQRCEICDEYDWLSKHKCKPAWFVISEDEYNELEMGLWTLEEMIDDLGLVYARDHSTAAEKWAARDDQNSGEFYIASGNEVTVVVMRPDEKLEQHQKFVVTGEAVPEYTATTKK